MVLQYNHCIAEILGWKEAGLKENCIAIQLGVLQEVADLVKGIVLQHSGLRWAVSKVYFNTGRLGLECIAIQLANLYCEEAWPVSRYSGLATGCALGALGLFSIRFDSVLFLSRFLDIIREPGS